MKHNTINSIENLTKKEVINLRATEKGNVRSDLSNYALSIESAYKQLTAKESKSRNAANACKGIYKTALLAVSSCYPYQTATGELCTKTKDGYFIIEPKGTATAYKVVKMSVCNFIDWKTKRVENLVTIVDGKKRPEKVRK